MPFQCPLECGKRMRRRYLKSHQSRKCERRPFTCEYCDYKATHEKVVNDHWPKCQRYPEVCPNKCSNEVIEHRFVQNHLDKNCPLQEIECEFSHAGCRGKVKRQAMKDHLEAKKDEHLKMVSAKCTKLESKVNDLILAFTQKDPKPVFIPPPQIVMNDFDKLKNDGTLWYSPPFYTHIGGYKMCLGIGANGWRGGEGTHVGVAVRMMKGEFDSHLKWPFMGEIKIQLVNQKEGRENTERKIALSDCSDVLFQRVTEDGIAKRGRGKSKFISHTDLYNPDEGKEYLKNDILIFKVTKVTVTSV